MIEVGNYGEILSDDTIHALQLLDPPAAQEPECCSPYHHAVSDEEAPSTMRLRAQVGDQVMLLLVDSGSTHSFFSESFLSRLSVETEPLPPVSVRGGNGQHMHCDKIVRSLPWEVPGHTFHTDLRVLQLSAYDGVLGMDWLSQHNPMNCHWQLKTISFQVDDKTVHLPGVRTTDLPPITESDAYELQHMEIANDIWTTTLVTVVRMDKPEPTPIPPNIQKLLSEYKDVFAEPCTLPPCRQYDHSINLEPDSTPINTKPYRYSPTQKDEIEKQVQDMLQSGVIAHSSSPYAAPVLLINLRAGYHQIRMREEDEENTAFKTHHGNYHFV
ncbi:uncharacterized protein [Aegilops tauschii subsp. strangulata]|uniref:uncharacterized protein n=1 Tax=Aegilops tauschii subsp. strangulata TaxID=200361 RepID=UPI003CC8A0D0